MDEVCCIEVEVPKPIVKKPRMVKFKGIDIGVRIGRGFSIGELKAVGIDVKLAKQLNIPVDSRRKGVHEENIESLRRFIEEIREVIEAKKAKPARNVKLESQKA
jgi:large subunit ribosomal protein L13e